MSKQYNIKWRDVDERQLQRAVKNYNAKIARLEKSEDYGVDRHLLPKRVSVKDLRTKVGTRQEFNREMKKLQDFTQRGGEYRFKWRENDEAKISRAVKNFNAKITRLEKADPKNKAALPERYNVKYFKRMIGTRQDLNREIKALERFTKPGSEELVSIPGNDYNLKTTKWQKEEMERRAPGINEKRQAKKDKLSEVDLTSRGKSLGYKKGQIGMRKAEEVALDPIVPFTSKMNRPDLKMKFRQIIRESQSDYWDRRDEILRKNYIKGLEQNFNSKDITGIIDIIENMDFTEFRKIFEAEGGNFEPLYPPRSDEEYKEYLSAINATWNPQR